MTHQLLIIGKIFLGGGEWATCISRRKIYCLLQRKRTKCADWKTIWFNVLLFPIKKGERKNCFNEVVTGTTKSLWAFSASFGCWTMVINVVAKTIMRNQHDINNYYGIQYVFYFAISQNFFSVWVIDFRLCFSFPRSLFRVETRFCLLLL